MKNMRVLIYFIGILFSVTLMAQESSRHPRVLELEDYYKEKANRILSNRFKDMPFLITVRIDPLRRTTGNEEYRPKNETLPFFDLEYENIKDEWDDPTASLYSLTNRIRSATVNVIIPESVSEGESAEIREALIQDLRLIPGRDRIQLSRRRWGSQIDLEIYGMIIGITIMAFLFGLFFIQRLSIGKLVKALSIIQDQVKSQSDKAPSAPVAPMSMPQTQTPNTPTHSGAGMGDIRLSDNHKTREIFRQRLNDLVVSDSFPNIGDMLTLEELATENPKLLGAFLNELPLGDQRRIFSLSSGQEWFSAYADPGSVDYQTLDLIESLLRHRPETNNRKLQDLVIQVWRLGDQSSQLLRDLDQDVAFSILSEMPKSLSVPIGRAAFPGAWGALLDPNKTYKQLTDKELDEAMERGLKLKPKNSMKELKDYIRDRDLLRFLKKASVAEEREIYTAAKGAFLEYLRPPFFRVLDADAMNLYLVFVSFTVDDWALALFNIPKDERQAIESLFSEKQRFLFLEKMKQLDESRPSEATIGVIRERIAEVYFEMVRREELASESGNEKAA